MPSLSRDLRRLLEKTIAGDNGARQIAEDGAERSLQRLAVDKHEPHTSLTPEERTLRNRLRAHGRQVGDKRDPQRGNQTITHLRQAVAYEHWHRMLFARFLAENDLLLHPEHGVALSLDEVKELALRDKRDWIEVAADFAQRMLLSAVFRSDDPALEVALPVEKRLDLERKLNELPREIFLADDSLGWVYQFWQKDAKEKVDAEIQTGEKADAGRIPAKTQLFTEDYMVLFLLENTLGAWWTARQGSEKLNGYEWTYLRTDDDGAAIAGSFDAWPSSGKDVRILDPCMGSGHFLTFALRILARIRAAEEGIDLKEAIYATLRDNVFGLELDARCSQIAAFNLALTAWKLGGCHFELPTLNLACTGVGINAREEDWVKLGGSEDRLREAMRKLFNIFSEAPTLGSLIDPSRIGATLFGAEFEEVRHLLQRALAAEHTSDDSRELAIAAEGLLAAAALLTRKFTLVATNVPYLGRGKQDDILKEHCDTYHTDAKADLATCFVDRGLRACDRGGSVALVTPQNWLYQKTYKDFRARVAKSCSWDFVARLGEHAFESSAAAGAFAALVGITNSSPTKSREVAAWDVLDCQTPLAKAENLRTRPPHLLTSRLYESDPNRSLRMVARCYQGMSTGDNPRLVLNFWEPSALVCWRFFQVPSKATKPVGGRTCVVRDLVLSKNYKGGAIRGREAWGNKGVAITRIRSLAATLYDGDFFANTMPVIVPNDISNLLAIWTFAESEEFREAVTSVSRSLSVDNGYIEQVPFDLSYWQAISSEKYPNGLPTSSSVDPTQWVFNGHPKGSENPLQVAVARLVGYRWPRQMGVGLSYSSALGLDSLEKYGDPSGIVCLASVSGEETAAVRLRGLLQAAFGSEYNLSALLKATRSETLEAWLRDEFFEEHCSLFGDAPFVWHVWDGLKEGFHALVNYHMLDYKNLEKLIYSYLGDWLTRQRQELSSGVEGADTRLAAAEHLQKELRQILEGSAPYDIFVRWKPLSEQAVGWEPDSNDGVRVNIRPWITAARLYKASKPGILRVQPNIKYTKDLGKESPRDPKDFPWFKSSADRLNDHHLTLEEKKRARETL